MSPARARRRKPPPRIHLLLAAGIGLIGLLNMLLSLGVVRLDGNLGLLEPLDESLTEGFAVFGRSGQLGLGLALFLTGGGLWFRQKGAWGFSLLLLFAMLATSVVKGQRTEILVLGAPILAIIGLLILYRRAFYRQQLGSNLLIALFSLAAALSYATLGSFLLGNSFSPKIADLQTALYYAMVTLSTVGFGDFVATTGAARIFTVTVIVFGLGVFVTSVATILSTSIYGNLKRVLAPEGGYMNMTGHVIVVGGGAIAENAVAELHSRKQQFVRVLPTGTPAPNLVIGDPTEDLTLERAGIEGARLIIAAMEEDAQNALIALTAKDLNPGVLVLALAENPERVPRLKRARADLVFSPAAVGGRLLATLAEGKSISPEFEDLLSGKL